MAHAPAGARDAPNCARLANILLGAQRNAPLFLIRENVRFKEYSARRSLCTMHFGAFLAHLRAWCAKNSTPKKKQRRTQKNAPDFCALLANASFLALVGVPKALLVCEFCVKE